MRTSVASAKSSCVRPLPAAQGDVLTRTRNVFGYFTTKTKQIGVMNFTSKLSNPHHPSVLQYVTRPALIMEMLVIRNHGEEDRF